jgi:hypothetical protein
MEQTQSGCCPWPGGFFPVVYFLDSTGIMTAAWSDIHISGDVPLPISLFSHDPNEN